MKEIFATLFAIVACAVFAYFIVNSYFDSRVKRAEIEATKHVLIEEEKTERTEERSQFWQKLVPWGEDEQESGN